MKTAEEIIREKDRPIIHVPGKTSVKNAARIMVENKIGALLVKDGDDFTGIWTERDLLRQMVTGDFDPAATSIESVMTRTLRYAPHTATIYQLLDKFLGLRLRHLLIEKNDSVIGMLSTGDVVRASLVEKTAEFEKLNAFVSWEYYENWKWEAEKR